MFRPQMRRRWWTFLRAGYDMVTGLRLRAGWMVVMLCAGVCASAHAQYVGASPQQERTPPAGLTDSSDVVAALLATPRPPLVLDIQ